MEKENSCYLGKQFLRDCQLFSPSVSLLFTDCPTFHSIPGFQRVPPKDEQIFYRRLALNYSKPEESENEDYIFTEIKAIRNVWRRAATIDPTLNKLAGKN